MSHDALEVSVYQNDQKKSCQQDSRRSTGESETESAPGVLVLLHLENN